MKCDSGLYFYQSRCYGARLGRFTQADTIVPGADTSQALNRYAYVKNNPLRFTDPDGHGFWEKLLSPIIGFWKQIKPYIGTIVSVAFSMCGMPFIGAIVGSAVGTVVNGGNFKSFAIGVGIGIAAWAIAGFIGGGAEAFSDWASKGIIEGLAAGALTGAIAGAISSAVYGGKTYKNIISGAKNGLLGAAVGMTTRAVLNLVAGDFIAGIRANIELIKELYTRRPLIADAAPDPNSVIGNFVLDDDIAGTIGSYKPSFWEKLDSFLTKIINWGETKYYAKNAGRKIEDAFTADTVGISVEDDLMIKELGTSIGLNKMWGGDAKGRYAYGGFYPLMEGSGLGRGVTASFCWADGCGSWEGDFVTHSITIGFITVSNFKGGHWNGHSIGVGLGFPFGAMYKTQIYKKVDYWPDEFE